MQKHSPKNLLFFGYAFLYLLSTMYAIVNKPAMAKTASNPGISGSFVGVGDSVGVGVVTGEAVGLHVGVAVAPAVGLGEGVSPGVNVAVAVGVGVGVTPPLPPFPPFPPLPLPGVGVGVSPGAKKVTAVVFRTRTVSFPGGAISAIAVIVAVPGSVPAVNVTMAMQL